MKNSKSEVIKRILLVAITVTVMVAVIMFLGETPMSFDVYVNQKLSDISVLDFLILVFLLNILTK